MMVSLGGRDYPVYADVSAADAYLAGDVLRALPWATRNADAKARGLISATRALQALPWSAGAPPSLDAVPEAVTDVCALFASDLLGKPKLLSDASGNSNVRLARAGTAEVEFFSRSADLPPLPKALWQLLVLAGLVGGFTAGPVSSGDEVYVSGLDGGPAAPGAGWDHPPYWTDPSEQYR